MFPYSLEERRRVEGAGCRHVLKAESQNAWHYIVWKAQRTGRRKLCVYKGFAEEYSPEKVPDHSQAFESISLPEIQPVLLQLPLEPVWLAV